MTERVNDGLKLGTVKLGSQEVVLRHAGDEDSENCITVSVSPNEHSDKVVQLAVDEVKRTRWWLQDYWERKALPVQQVELSDGVHQVTVYSWGQQLQKTQLETFAKVFGSFSGVKNGFIFNHFRYLLIDDNQPSFPGYSKCFGPEPVSFGVDTCSRM